MFPDQPRLISTRSRDIRRFALTVFAAHAEPFTFRGTAFNIIATRPRSISFIIYFLASSNRNPAASFKFTVLGVISARAWCICGIPTEALGSGPGRGPFVRRR